MTEHTGSGAKKKAIDDYLSRKSASMFPDGFVDYSLEGRMERAKKQADRINELTPLGGQKILEVGTGAGDLAFCLATHYDCEVVALDILEDPAWRDLHHPRLQFIVGDLTQQRLFADDAFTRIVSWSTWEHIRHPFAALAECQRILDPKGTKYLHFVPHRSSIGSHLFREIDFPWPNLLFSPDELREQFGLSLGHAFWTNQLAYAHYLLYFKKLGFHVVHEKFDRRPFNAQFYEQFKDRLELYPSFDLRTDMVEVVLQFDPQHPKKEVADPVYQIVNKATRNIFLPENHTPTCNLCGGTVFAEYSGRPNAICTGCRSLERHRILRAVWDQYLTTEVGLRNKRILAFAPAPCVRKYLYAGCDLVSADVDDTTGVDIVADIADMTAIADGSFDIVEVSAVLNHCHDDVRAAAELRRVLRPGGIVVIWVPYRTNAQTKESTDIDVSTYGRAKFDKHKIADWRSYGDLGLIDVLSPHFVVKTYHGQDPVTNKVNIIFVGFRREHEVTPRAAP